MDHVVFPVVVVVVILVAAEESKHCFSGVVDGKTRRMVGVGDEEDRSVDVSWWDRNDRQEEDDSQVWQQHHGRCMSNDLLSMAKDGENGGETMRPATFLSVAIAMNRPFWETKKWQFWLLYRRFLAGWLAGCCSKLVVLVGWFNENCCGCSLLLSLASFCLTNSQSMMRKNRTEYQIPLNRMHATIKV